MVGQIVSHYQILERLGGGGMGVVYKARDLKLDRTVALKFLPAEFTEDSTAKKRFTQEAKSASALQHPNICTVHDIDQTDDGKLFIVMDQYEGKTLRTLIGEKPLTIGEIVSIAGQIARGLLEAHRHGIVHRDIKPGNIILTERGEVKILDFGLAKSAGATRLTAVGSTGGTIAYMSPEQIRGEPTDNRTDIWSFGVVLYEMLTQRLPFPGDHAPAIMYSIANQNPDSLASIRHDVPESLRRLCERCLEKDAQLRLSSMEEVLTQLERSETAPSRHIERILRRKSVAAALVILAIGGVLFAASRLLNLKFPGSQSAAGSRIVIGVLPFKNSTRDTTIDSWSEVVQQMFFNSLINGENLSVYDPAALNDRIESSFGGSIPEERQALYDAFQTTPIRLILQGTILKIGLAYRLQLQLTDRTNKALKYPLSANFSSEADLQHVVDSLSQRISDFLQVEGISPGEKADLKLWSSPRMYNYAALRQLVIATRYNYKMDPNSTQYIRRAVELDSSYVPARVWLIQRLLSLGSREEAQHHYEYLKSIQTQCSSYEQVMIDYAGAFVSGDIQGQMAKLRIWLEYYSPGNNILLFSLARLQFMKGDYEGCAKTLEPAIDTHWEFPLIYYYAGASLLQLGRDDKARALLEESVNMGSVYSDCYRQLSVVCRSQNDTVASQKYEQRYLSAAMREGISAATAYGWLAGLNHERKLFAHAADLYGMAIAEQGDIAAYHLGLANVFLDTGNTLLAKKEFTQVLVLDTASAEAHYRLAEIFEREGKNQESLEHSKEYLRLAPTGEFASDARSRMLRLQH